MVKIPYVRNFGERKRESSKERERETREDKEMRENGLEALFYFSRRPRHAGAQGAMLEHGQVLDSSFRCLESALEHGAARSSVAPKLPEF